ncbi:hypothetical protein WJX73_009900 [Symbiochloris irregularis]|uniref:F-box domain-containing protein n=1 Tax=Symbiochloris irregularis TaxID=706552 RepID=A0AAW1PZC9_9CHLO
MEGWNDLPRDLIANIASSFNVQQLATARLICKGWRDGVSASVRWLKPRLDGSLFSLQLHQLGLMQVVFPFLQTLDLRGFAHLGPQQVRYFQDTPWLQHVLLNFHSDEKLSATVHQLKELVNEFQACAPHVRLLVELGSSAHPMTTCLVRDGPGRVTDALLQDLVDLPDTVSIVQLTLPRTYWAQKELGKPGLMCLHKLTNLRFLQLFIASNPLDDDVVSSFACLTLVEELHLGNIQEVTDTGLVTGLGPMRRLRHLALHQAVRITDAAWLALTSGIKLPQSQQDSSQCKRGPPSGPCRSLWNRVCIHPGR